MLIDGIASIIADCYVLQFKTRVAYWNAAGPLLFGLQRFAGEQEAELSDAIGVLARRMRGLGYPAPERLSQLIARSQIDEERGVVEATALDMVRQLAADHEAVCRNIRTVADWATQMKDQVTFDLLAGRLTKHEDAVWVLKALIA